LLKQEDQEEVFLVNSSPPSRDPSKSDGDMVGTFQIILEKFLQSDINNRLPARIISFDRDANRASVQPLISLVNTSGEIITYNQLASVPVFNIGGGNCILSFNLNPGDLGWIQACDRDIAEFLKFYREAAPATNRMHDFNSGVFIPDVMTGYSIDGEDSGNAVLQTTDGSVRVSIFPDKVKITAPDVEVSATNITLDGATSIGAGGGGAPIARLGDSVQVSTGSGSGTITGGSATNTAT
jgi:hypothetical protein